MQGWQQVNKNLLLLGLIFASLLIVGFLLIDTSTSSTSLAIKSDDSVKKEHTAPNGPEISYHTLSSSTSKANQNAPSLTPKKEEVAQRVDKPNYKSISASSKAMQNPLVTKSGHYSKRSFEKTDVQTQGTMEQAYEQFYSSLLPKNPTPKDIEKLKKSMPPPPPILPLPH